jgi:hypothetical protein
MIIEIELDNKKAIARILAQATHINPFTLIVEEGRRLQGRGLL